MNVDEVHRIQSPEGEWVLAFGCECGDPPNKKMAVVKLDEPVRGLDYQFCHVNCLRKVEDE